MVTITPCAPCSPEHVVQLFERPQPRDGTALAKLLSLAHHTHDPIPELGLVSEEPHQVLGVFVDPDQDDRSHVATRRTAAAEPRTEHATLDDEEHERQARVHTDDTRRNVGVTHVEHQEGDDSRHDAGLRETGDLERSDTADPRPVEVLRSEAQE